MKPKIWGPGKILEIGFGDFCGEVWKIWGKEICAGWYLYIGWRVRRMKGCGKVGVGGLPGLNIYARVKLEGWLCSPGY